MSLEQLLVLLVIGFFLLGPERLPHVVVQLARHVRRLRERLARFEAEYGAEVEQLRAPLREIAALRSGITAPPPSAPSPVLARMHHHSEGTAPFDPEAT